jgi:peptidoglycan/LPS O-acetylase OafA/YrhL
VEPPRADGATAASTGPGATPRSARAGGPGGHLPYFPALEGLRGVAVVAVLLFHSGFEWMRGGYLGVSTFFTLSGFLITSLLLAERGATASINLRTFWVRRVRRLMPAALATLALVALFGVFGADAVQKRNLAGDVVACLAYVANWRFLFTQQSYADLFANPSPVLHFWSLAIEEQFYVLYPLMVWLVLQKLDKTRQWFAGLLVTLIGVSVGISLFGGLTKDAIYYGTETRASELLIGALLAVFLYHHKVTRIIANDDRVRSAISFAGVVGLAGCALAWVYVSQPNHWLYDGGLPSYAFLSAAVILACITPGGPVRWLLGQSPFRFVGRISYGVYLFHWPVFLWVTEARTQLAMPAVLAIRLAITFALALVSYRFLEMPIRRGERLLRIPSLALAPVAIIGVAAAVIANTVSAPKPVIDFDRAAADFQNRVTTPNAPPAKAIDTTAHEPPFPRLAFFGDSTALMTGLGVAGWADDTKQADVVDGFTLLGCGIGRGGERRSGNEQGLIPAECNHWERNWAQKIKNHKPNIAVVQVGPWEVEDRKLQGDNTWRTVGDPVYDEYLTNEMLLAVDTLSAEGADVLWLTSPPVGAGQGQDAQQIRGQGADPVRMQALNALINRLPTERPGKVHVIDLAGWLASTGDDARLRPDGVHFGIEHLEGREAAERFLGPAIVDAFKADWKARAELGTTPGTSTPGSSIPPSTTPTQPPSTAFNGPKRKVLVLGDASAQPVVDALTAWGQQTGTLEIVSLIEPQCGVVKAVARVNKATLETTPAECENVTFAWIAAAVNNAPDMVLVVPSVWDVTDVQLPGEPAVRALGDQTYDDAAYAQFAAMADALHKAGPPVAWMTFAPIEWGKGDQPPPASPYAASDPARVERYNELVSKLAVASGSQRWTGKIDFGKFAADWTADSPPLTPDGLAVGPDAAPIVAEWLGNELLLYYDVYKVSGN